MGDNDKWSTNKILHYLKNTHGLNTIEKQEVNRFAYDLIEEQQNEIKELKISIDWLKNGD